MGDSKYPMGITLDQAMVLGRIAQAGGHVFSSEEKPWVRRAPFEPMEPIQRVVAESLEAMQLARTTSLSNVDWSCTITAKGRLAIETMDGEVVDRSPNIIVMRDIRALRAIDLDYSRSWVTQAQINRLVRILLWEPVPMRQVTRYGREMLLTTRNRP